jgi:hypothetical protein
MKKSSMTKTAYAEYTSGPEWKARAEQCKRLADNKCERCNMPRWLAEIVYDQDLAAHHLTYARKGCELPEDLEALCRRCHEIETFGRSEFRDMKRATCVVCADKHFDLRSDVCEPCNRLLANGPELFQVLTGGIHPFTSTHLWRTVMTEINTAVSVGSIPIRQFSEYLWCASDIAELQRRMESRDSEIF